jgi:AcrR family transcriptional regulator
MSTEVVSLTSVRPVRRSRAEARESNRHALLAAAHDLIVEVGYNGAQLDEIADRAGLTKGAIYSIFGGKLELFRAVITEHARATLPLLDWDLDAAEAVTAEDLVAELGRKYVEFLDAQDSKRMLAFELDLAGLALRDQATLDVMLSHERAMTKRLAQALTGRQRRDGGRMPAAQAALAADLVLGALGGLGQRMTTSKWMTRDAETIAQALVRLLPADSGTTT